MFFIKLSLKFILVVVWVLIPIILLAQQNINVDTVNNHQLSIPTWDTNKHDGTGVEIVKKRRLIIDTNINQYTANLKLNTSDSNITTTVNILFLPPKKQDTLKIYWYGIQFGNTLQSSANNYTVINSDLLKIEERIKYKNLNTILFFLLLSVIALILSLNYITYIKKIFTTLFSFSKIKTLLSNNTFVNVEGYFFMGFYLINLSFLLSHFLLIKSLFPHIGFSQPLLVCILFGIFLLLNILHFLCTYFLERVFKIPFLLFQYKFNALFNELFGIIIFALNFIFIYNSCDFTTFVFNILCLIFLFFYIFKKLIILIYAFNLNNSGIFLIRILLVLLVEIAPMLYIYIIVNDNSLLIKKCLEYSKL